MPDTDEIVINLATNVADVEKTIKTLEGVQELLDAIDSPQTKGQGLKDIIKEAVDDAITGGDGGKVDLDTSDLQDQFTGFKKEVELLLGKIDQVFGHGNTYVSWGINTLATKSGLKKNELMGEILDKIETAEMPPELVNKEGGDVDKVRKIVGAALLPFLMEQMRDKPSKHAEAILGAIRKRNISSASEFGTDKMILGHLYGLYEDTMLGPESSMQERMYKGIGDISDPEFAGQTRREVLYFSKRGDVETYDLDSVKKGEKSKKAVAAFDSMMEAFGIQQGDEVDEMIVHPFAPSTLAWAKKRIKAGEEVWLPGTEGNPIDATQAYTKMFAEGAGEGSKRLGAKFMSSHFKPEYSARSDVGDVAMIRAETADKAKEIFRDRLESQIEFYSDAGLSELIDEVMTELTDKEGNIIYGFNVSAEAKLKTSQLIEDMRKRPGQKIPSIYAGREAMSDEQIASLVEKYPNMPFGRLKEPALQEENVDAVKEILKKVISDESVLDSIMVELGSMGKVNLAKHKRMQEVGGVMRSAGAVSGTTLREMVQAILDKLDEDKDEDPEAVDDEEEGEE
jgi:hypothetical protein